MNTVWYGAADQGQSVQAKAKAKAKANALGISTNEAINEAMRQYTEG